MQIPTKSTAVIGAGVETGGEVVYTAQGNPNFPANATLSQYGACEPCNIQLKSWSKLAKCPQCGGIVYLT